MPRESYYQDAGNPEQAKLLPTRPSRIALPFTGDASDKTTSTLFVWALGVLFLDLLYAGIQSWASPTVAARNHAVALLVGFATLALLTMRKRNALWLGPIYLTVAFLLTVSSLLDDDPFLPLLAAGMTLSVYTYVFAEHWIMLCSTQPLVQETANRLRVSWKRYLTVIAAAPFVAAVGAVCLRATSLFVYLLSLLSLVQLLLTAGRRETIIGPLAAIHSWMTYNLRDVRRNGIFLSPAGSSLKRRMITIATLLVVAAELRSASTSEGTLWLFLPSLLVIFGPAAFTWQLMADAQRHRRTNVTADEWQAFTADLRRSVNPIVRQSFYFGRVAADGSPLIPSRRMFGEHAHFLGGSGAGKTSLGLAPFVEQAVAFGDCSVIVLDLKADSLELLATMEFAAAQLQRRTGRQLPLKFFTNQDDLPTYAFNPLNQPFWNKFNYYLRTDILCGATGLEYGSDYGAGFYSSANSGVLHHTVKLFPDVRTFKELADACGYVLNKRDKNLHAEIRKSGVHVHEVLKRLAAFEALNIVNDRRYPADVTENAIDLTEVFRSPQLIYLHLSATLAPGASPAIARLFTYFLLAAATKTQRLVPVFLVIDEFQRMVAQNLEYLLQLARSMGVGVILANQSMEDLRTDKANLIPAIEANCRFRQWFEVPTAEDRQRVAATSGETVELLMSKSHSTALDGRHTATTTTSETILPRLSTNDILLASDHAKRSVVRISRGDGYAQYGGLPVVIESDFHITQEEYEQRRQLTWPTGRPGTFIAKELEDVITPPVAGPIISTEVIDFNSSAATGDTDSSTGRRTRRKRRRRNDS